MQAVALARGACGELVQGMVDGKYFLITCPIDIQAEATVTLIPGGRVQGPPGKGKALAAVRLALARLGEREWGVRLAINNPLPPGKGLASSTADVTAAAAATAVALGAELSLKEIKDIALAIEPSDGTFLPGIVLFDHRRGEFQEYLGEPPPLSVLIVDPGGMIDTVRFNQRRDLMIHNQAKEDAVRRAVSLVRQGLARGRADLLAEGATLSALANQGILYKPELETLLAIATRCGALGINTAHSGTVIGILHRPGEVDVNRMEAEIRTLWPRVRFIRADMTAGGVEAWHEPWLVNRQAGALKDWPRPSTVATGRGR